MSAPVLAMGVYNLLFAADSTTELGRWALGLAIIGGAIRVGTPFLFVSLGECITEKSGRVNLGLEGTLVMGAMTGYAISYQSGSPGWECWRPPASACSWRLARGHLQFAARQLCRGRHLAHAVWNGFGLLPRQALHPAKRSAASGA